MTSDTANMTLASDIQTLLQEKASLQSEIALLRMERDGLKIEVAELEEAKQVAAANGAVSVDQNSSKEAFPEEEKSEKAGDPQLDASNGSQISPPQHFICPLTLEIMSVPMQHKVTKHNFERKAIFEWIYFGKATCPLTRKKLHPEEFVEHVALRRKIDDWKAQHGWNDKGKDEDDEDDSDSDSDDDSVTSGALLIKDLTPAEEKEQQARLVETQIKRNGSHNQLMGIRSRVLRQRDSRVRRRLSAGGLF